MGQKDKANHNLGKKPSKTPEEKRAAKIEKTAEKKKLRKQKRRGS